MPVTNGGGGVPVGSVQHFAMSTPPAGWLKANGDIVSRQIYAGLFLAIGTTYGAGDGATTFKLPDLRGEFLRGWDDSRSIDTNRAIGSSQVATSIRTGVTTGLSIVVNNGESGVAGTHSYYANAIGTTSDMEYSVRPRNVALLACIKF